MNIWLPLAVLALTLQFTKIVDALLQKMGFAYPLRPNHKRKIIADDSASCDSGVEKECEKVIEFWVLMHFECDFIFGSLFEVEEEG